MHVGSITEKSQPFILPETILIVDLLLLRIILEMEINKKRQKRGGKQCVESPIPHTGATRPGEMEPQHQTRYQIPEQELRDLAIRHRPLPRRPEPQRRQQVVGVHHYVHGGVRHQPHREQRLRLLQPRVAHHHHRRVVVHVEEREPPRAGPAQQDQERVHELEELREVEHVGPEEGRAARRGCAAAGEADGPAGVARRRLVEDGEGGPDGHDEGEEAEDDVVGGGGEAEGGGGEGGEDGEAVEEEGEGEVGEDGDGEEERGGAGGLASPPLILADDWVVHQPIVDCAVESCAHFRIVDLIILL